MTEKWLTEIAELKSKLSASEAKNANLRKLGACACRFDDDDNAISECEHHKEINARLSASEAKCDLLSATVRQLEARAETFLINFSSVIDREASFMDKAGQDACQRIEHLLTAALTQEVKP